MNHKVSSCCICAKSENLVPIFGKDDSTKQLLSKIEFCLRMTIPVTDCNLAIAICCTCIFRLEVCYQFMSDHNKCKNELRQKNLGHVVTMRVGVNLTALQTPKEDTQLEIPILNEPQVINIVPGNYHVTNMTSESPSHNSSCNCEQCSIIRDGNLPLLVEVIERKSQNSNSSDSDGATATTYTKSKLKGNTNRSKCFCDFCGKEFSHKGDLNKHRRRHTGERPYSCDVCNKTFSHASNLLRHQKMHSGIKQFLCPVCEKGFYRKDKLSIHFKTVHSPTTRILAEEKDCPKSNSERGNDVNLDASTSTSC